MMKTTQRLPETGPLLISEESYMNGQFVVVLWLERPVSGGNLEEALAAANKIGLGGLLKLNPGVTNNDFRVDVAGVYNPDPLDRAGL
jgi:hypothetical protein